VLGFIQADEVLRMLECDPSLMQAATKLLGQEDGRPCPIESINLLIGCNGCRKTGNPETTVSRAEGRSPGWGKFRIADIPCESSVKGRHRCPGHAR
jgi:hypothetical protein